MSWFLGGIVFLVLGYFTYGRFVSRVLGPDGRKTPAMALSDGIDFVPLPAWKNLLIQLLNIAGIGPVIGVILGIKFGKVALLIIPVGCVFMGAVHDFLAGMMSLRQKGANLPAIVSTTLGRNYARCFSWILVLLLLLCVTVFINVPANLIDKTWLPEISFFWPCVIAVFLYYVVATLFPVDAIIGRFYPFFGALLIVGSLAVAVALVVAGVKNPQIMADCPDFAAFKSQNPIFPCLFVTIACGIISGFHATQSPIVARTLQSEHMACLTFFGMMIAEGVIAMIWAAAALAIYNVQPDTISLAGPVVLGRICSHFLGPYAGGMTVLAVVVLAVTSGDTALRASRLSLGDALHVSQASVKNRVLTTLPLIFVVSGLLFWSNRDAKSFSNLWNYFAWGNQMLSATTLLCGTVWLLRLGRRYLSLVSLLPAFFMTTVVASFILWTSGTNGQPTGLVPGGLSLGLAIAIGLVVAAAACYYAVRRGTND